MGCKKHKQYLMQTWTQKRMKMWMQTWNKMWVSMVAQDMAQQQQM